jgi:hypothetical protein
MISQPLTSITRGDKDGSDSVAGTLSDDVTPSGPLRRGRQPDLLGEPGTVSPIGSERRALTDPGSGYAT